MCEEYKILMNMVIDGEASPEDRWLLTEHLKVCAACRSEYEQLQYIANRIRDMEEDVPADLHSTIMAGIKDVKPAIRIPYKFIKTAGIAVAACCVIAAAGMFLPSMGNFAAKSDMAAERVHVDTGNTSATGMASSTSGGMSYDSVADKSSDANMPTADAEYAATTSPQDNGNTGNAGTTSGEVTHERAVYVLTCNGVLPAVIDKLNPSYLSGEVVISFDTETEMLDAYKQLMNAGCVQTSDYALSNECTKLIGSSLNSIVIIVK